MCPKKYEEVFQQLNQYAVFVVSTGKNTVEKTVCNRREVREPNVCLLYTSDAADE